MCAISLSRWIYCLVTLIWHVFPLKVLYHICNIWVSWNLIYRKNRFSWWNISYHHRKVDYYLIILYQRHKNNILYSVYPRLKNRCYNNLMFINIFCNKTSHFTWYICYSYFLRGILHLQQTVRICYAYTMLS